MGLLFEVHGQRPWMISHGYVPTAHVLYDRIRVFAAFWDRHQIGRIGYVDFERSDPTRVIGHSMDPVLNVGVSGAFDEHGTTPMSVVVDGDILRLYYAGWQRSNSVRYLLFTGLAVSHDDGEHFERMADVPVLDRINGHHLVRTGFIAKHGATWRAWLAQSSGTVTVGGKITPSYTLDHIESEDGVTWPTTSSRCFAHGHDGIFGYGRSAIWRAEDGYHAMLSVRRHSGYRIEYSRSSDGLCWSTPTLDGYALLPHKMHGPQTETMFPSVVRVDDTVYAFYNGDDFGRHGVRCARWNSMGKQ